MPTKLKTKQYTLYTQAKLDNIVILKCFNSQKSFFLFVVRKIYVTLLLESTNELKEPSTYLLNAYTAAWRVLQN